MDQDREDRVRARAYEIWDRDGRKEGSHDAHWQQAENEVEEEASAEVQQEASGTPARTGSTVATGGGAEGPPSGVKPGGVVLKS